MLIEVMISALVLGLVAAATVTGVQAINFNNANQRFHNQATQVAAQSQEELRADPISLLEALARTPHTYTTKVGGTTYTVTQEAHDLGSSGKGTACSAVEHANTAAPNYRITSSVTWSPLPGGHPVAESAIITPPTGSALQVDIDNAEPVTAGVSGVTAIVTYVSAETHSQVTLQGTTGSAGCVLFTGIRSTSAKVEVQERTGFVTPTGALTPTLTPAEVSIAPNITEQKEFVYNEGGRIEAAFTYNGESEYAGKEVTGNTFVAHNEEMNLEPELELGSASFAAPQAGGEELYNASTGGYAHTALTATATKYPYGDLFPFLSKWTVYAGDCAANEPKLVDKTETVSPGSGVVSPAASTPVAVPESLVNLRVYEGTKAAPSPPTSHFEVTITNASCSKAPPATPNHAAGATYTHKQQTSPAQQTSLASLAGELEAGELEAPFQPFGALEICVDAAPTRHDLLTYEADKVTGPTVDLYTGELSAAEKAKEREEAEAPAREKREAEEAPTKTKKAAEEANRTSRIEKEEEERKTWETDEHSSRHHVSNQERKAKEKTQETERKAIEETEKAAAEKREKEEAPTRKEREEEEAKRAPKIKAEEKEISELPYTVESVSSGTPC